MRPQDVATQSNFQADRFTCSRWHSPTLALDSHSELLLKGSAVEHSLQNGMNTYCRCLNSVLLTSPHSSNDSFFAFRTWACPWPQKSPPPPFIFDAESSVRSLPACHVTGEVQGCCHTDLFVMDYCLLQLWNPTAHPSGSADRSFPSSVLQGHHRTVIELSYDCPDTIFSLLIRYRYILNISQYRYQHNTDDTYFWY